MINDPRCFTCGTKSSSDYCSAECSGVRLELVYRDRTFARPADYGAAPCATCGTTIARTSNRQKFCFWCAAENKRSLARKYAAEGRARRRAAVAINDGAAWS